jgi:hypothetical protein
MKLVRRIKLYFDEYDYPELKDPTDGGLWDEDELDLHPLVGLDHDYRYVEEIYEKFENVGAKAIFYKSAVKKDKTNCVTDEIDFRAYQFGSMIFCVRGRTHFSNPTDHMFSTVKEHISIKIYSTDETEDSTDDRDYFDLPINLN